MLERNLQGQLRGQPGRPHQEEDMYQHRGKGSPCLLSQAPVGCFADLGPPCLFFPIPTQWDSSQECVKTRAAESALTSRLQCASKAVWLQFTPFAGLLHRQKAAAKWRCILSILHVFVLV